MPDIQTIIIRMLLALLVGGIIGAEREYRSKSAGFRTMIVIAMGACIFTCMSQLIGPGNPDRIASNIITGIGFLGAGIIFKADDRVQGLTTAATIWLTAALGMMVGGGYYIPAFVGCGLTMLVLISFRWLENRIDIVNQIRNYRIVCEYKSNEQLAKYEALFKHHHLRFRRNRQTRRGSDMTGTWVVWGREKDHQHLIEIILADSDVKEFEF